MKIKELRINGFGKIKDRNVNLNDGINIIYGENESGKSTILKFITSMFFGLTKNKNGGSIPEIEKYEPWNNEEFSGKILYELDNKETFEIYRDFKKKNPKIFNKNLEDISKNFNVDKTKGIQFFFEQVGIEEEIFNSSVITKQTEVKLDEKAQNTLIQKISNILGTGEDNTSYSTIANKLKKKINDEVGTSNTRERPINLVENKLKSLKSQKESLIEFKESKNKIEEIIKEKNKEISKIEKELYNLKLANSQKEKLIEQESRIKINNEIINNIQNQVEEIEEQKEKIINKQPKKSIKLKLSCEIIILVLSVISLVLVKNMLLKIIAPILFIAFTIYLILNIKKQNKRIKEHTNSVNEFNRKIEDLEKNKQQQLETIQAIQTEYNKNIDKIKLENNINNIEKINELIDEVQTKLNRANINLYEIQLDNKNATEKLETLVNIEEEIKELEEEKNELEQKSTNIKRALEALEIAYNKVREQVTPEFTEELSKTMEKISDGKYKNVQVNIDGKIIVESKNGEYIDAENLSIGTIDQIYLSLRIATIKKLTKDNMPIILDEAFAYYDEKRLENILKYLSEEYKEKQIIIFTCTKREKEILNMLNIKYNLVEI